VAVSNDRPIVITMGDPSGVGPVTVKALVALGSSTRRGFAVIGDRVLDRALAASGIDMALVAPGGDASP
jgi:4-hydroxythreonine-4-phosphate dehydrogenase